MEFVLDISFNGVAHVLRGFWFWDLSNILDVKYFFVKILVDSLLLTGELLL